MPVALLPSYVFFLVSHQYACSPVAQLCIFLVSYHYACSRVAQLCIFLVFSIMPVALLPSYVFF